MNSTYQRPAFWFHAIIYTLLLINGCTMPDEHEKAEAAIIVRAPILNADSLYFLGEHLKTEGKTDSAVISYKLAIHAEEESATPSKKLLRYYSALSDVYLSDFKYESAYDYLEKARALAESNIVSPDTLIDTYFKLSDCKSNMKDFQLSVSMLEKTIALISKHYPQDNSRRALAYRILSGSYYNIRRYDESIKNSLQAISYTRTDDHKQLASNFTSLGMSYRELGKYDEAIKCYNTAIHHDLRWTSPDSEEIAIRNVFKSYTFLAMKAFDSAKYCLHRNLSIRRRVHGEKNVNTFGAKYSLGQFFQTISEPDSAIRYYQSSLISLISSFNETDWRQNPKGRIDEMNTNLVIGLVGKASSLKLKYQNDTIDTSLLEHAMSTYLLADSVLAQYQRNFISDDPQLMQLESGYIPYSEMVDISFELFRKTNDQKHLEKSLAVMERSRAVVLRQSLARAEAFNKAGIPETFREAENQVIKKRQEILQLLTREQYADKQDSLRERLLEVDSEHRNIQAEIQRLNPEYFSIKYQDKPTRLRDLVDKMKSGNSILYEYLWSNDKIYVLVVSPETVTQRIIPVTPQLVSAYRNIENEVTGDVGTVYDQNRFREFGKNAGFLFDQFLGKELNAAMNVENIIISADGPLSSFPFEVLLTESPNSDVVDYRMNYVSLKYPISYTFSARLLLDRQNDGNSEGVLAFAYSTDPSATAAIANLPGTEREVNTIRDVISDEEGLFFFGSDATENSFKQKISDFNVVHLALHGVADTTNELESHLIFRSEKDSVEDGELYAHELYDLNMKNLDLAVLSACESGIGKSQMGEGVMSIARGFAYSGCPSLVVTLWKVDDRAASEIVGDFYKKLSEGERIDFSLTEARRNYLARANEFNSHPAYWAAFIHIGSSSPVYKQSSYWLWLVTAGVLLLIPLAIQLKKRFA